MEHYLGKPDEVIPRIFALDRDTVYEFSINKHKDKRSLDANAYYWVLLGKIASALTQDKQKLHLQFLKNYGVTYQVATPNKELSGIKYYELDGIREKEGKRLYIFNIYKPSSEMNTYEMSKLIDGIVEEAKNLDIETMTPYEIQMLKEEWK